MSLTAGQAKFSSVFSRETGLNPQVVGAWLLAEQSGSAAKYYEGKGYNNWLNIANTDSGPKGGAGSTVWRNPETAAKASAEWMRGQGQIAREYGKPASSITAILGSHGQVPHRQIQAIANSGWASSGYEHGNTLSQLLGQVGDIPTTGPGPLPGVARQGAIASVSGGAFNAQGYQQAAQHAAGERNAASLFTGGGSGESLLHSALEQAGSVPNVSSFSGMSKLGGGPVAAAGAIPAPTHAPSGNYVKPFEGATAERIDQGQDFSMAPGTPIRAIGDGVVTAIVPGWSSGQPLVAYKLTSGSHAGHTVYVAEQIAPAVKVGQRVSAGQPIGQYAAHGTGIETGWADGMGAGGVLAQSREFSGSNPTKSGQSFSAFLKALGVQT
jgi:murein DD-endopeptidase MepM/ murein hydrolase activator NlpD